MHFLSLPSAPQSLTIPSLLVKVEWNRGLDDKIIIIIIKIMVANNTDVCRISFRIK